MEELLAKEKQLQELLEREAELSPEQREELLRQLAYWPTENNQVWIILVGRNIDCS